MHHDFNYLIGNKEADRVKSDWQFYEYLFDGAQNTSAGWWSKWFYVSVAWLYYRGVRSGGRAHFYYGEHERSEEDLWELVGEMT